MKQNGINQFVAYNSFNSIWIDIVRQYEHVCVGVSSPIISIEYLNVINSYLNDHTHTPENFECCHCQKLEL